MRVLIERFLLIKKRFDWRGSFTYVFEINRASFLLVERALNTAGKKKQKTKIHNLRSLG